MWDVTWVKGPYLRQVYALHVIMDLYSRKIVGWTLQPREDKKIAATLMEQNIQAEGHGTVKVVHSDNGAIMTSKDMAKMLTRFGVQQSLIRPSVSNDNPHCESVNRTIKHHRLGLAVYDCIAEAETLLSRVIEAYNTTDYHCGIANFIPAQVHDGSWEATARARRDTVGRYYAHHPQRFNRAPRIKLPPKRVSINADRPDDEYLLVR